MLKPSSYLRAGRTRPGWYDQGEGGKVDHESSVKFGEDCDDWCGNVLKSADHGPGNSVGM